MLLNSLRTLCLCLLLAACAGGPPPQSSLARYDLPDSGLAQPVLQLRSLEVNASPWLVGEAMYYRLAYADGNRREQFANSRWSAQPAQLLAVRLQRSLIGSGGKPASACHLQLQLDDLVQVFDSASSSQLLLEARATLYGPQQAVLGRKTMRLQAAAGGNAAGGVNAAGYLLTQLSRELHDWARSECQPKASLTGNTAN